MHSLVLVFNHGFWVVLLDGIGKELFQWGCEFPEIHHHKVQDRIFYAHDAAGHKKKQLCTWFVWQRLESQIFLQIN